MGFGLLLCGYFILTMMSVGMADYAFAAYLIGGVVTYMAAQRLKDYNPRFLWTAITAIVYVVLSLYGGLTFVENTFLLGVVPVGGVFSRVASIVLTVAEISLHASILWSVLELGIELSIEKIKVQSVRDMILTGLWAIATVVLILFPRVAEYENQTITKLVFLFQLICYVLNAWLLYSCFVNICPAGEENGAPRKRSRFAFVNKINDKLDAKAAKALQESLDYQAEKQREREERRMSKKQKKKRRK